MSVKFEYDPELKLLVVTCTGPLFDADLLGLFRKSQELGTRYPVQLAILDGIGVTEISLSSGLVQSLAHSPPMFSEESDRCVVAPQDYMYGMARMYQMLGGETRERLRVVRTMEQAYEHLGIEAPPRLQPIEA